MWTILIIIGTLLEIVFTVIALRWRLLAKSEHERASILSRRCQDMTNDRDLALAELDDIKYKVGHQLLKLQQAEKRAANIAAEANLQINDKVTDLSETLGYKLADTLKLPQLSHHERVSHSGDWQLLEEYQTKASLPSPRGRYLTVKRRLYDDHIRDEHIL